MLSYTDLKPGTNFIRDGQPYTVLDYSFEKKQRQAPTVVVTARNILNDKTRDMTLRQHEEFEEADIERIPYEFIYEHRGSYVFKDPEDPGTRPELDADAVGEAKDYLKEGLTVELVKFNGEVVGIDLPIKVSLKVTQAPPAVKGNTADGATKKVKVETGAEIKTPIFIERGDVIRVNTETGEYVERTKKSS